jgi:hypothetical protein
MAVGITGTIWTLWAFALMKKYLLARWKKRWPVVPTVAGMAVLWVLRSRALHDGKELNSVLLAICFVVVYILFPLHWGPEHWKD